MTAVDRFKRRLADAIEMVCVLEERVEFLEQRIAELEAEKEPPDEEEP